MVSRPLFGLGLGLTVITRYTRIIRCRPCCNIYLNILVSRLLAQITADVLKPQSCRRRTTATSQSLAFNHSLHPSNCFKISLNITVNRLGFPGICLSTQIIVDHWHE